MASNAPLRSPLDKIIPSRPKIEVSLSAFAYLYSEMVQYAQDRSLSVSDIEHRLEEAGRGVGHKVLELQGWRERQGKADGKRENRLIGILTFISSNVWKSLFNKAADSLERSTEEEDEYMIYDALPVTNTFVSVPPDLGSLNCAAYIAGIIAGILDAAQFPAKVHAVSTPPEEGSVREKTVFLIKFSREVMEREVRLGTK